METATPGGDQIKHENPEQWKYASMTEPLCYTDQENKVKVAGSGDSRKWYGMAGGWCTEVLFGWVILFL